MNKYIVCLLIVWSLLSCDDKRDTLKTEMIIKAGTTFFLNEKKDSSNYILMDSVIIERDTFVYGYKYEDSDLLFDIPLLLFVDSLTLGGFYIYNINDTIYIKEPLYGIYSNVTITRGKTTLITFNDTNPIYNPPIKNLEYDKISISIVGEIEIK